MPPTDRKRFVRRQMRRYKYRPTTTYYNSIIPPTLQLRPKEQPPSLLPVSMPASAVLTLQTLTPLAPMPAPTPAPVVLLSWTLTLYSLCLCLCLIMPIGYTLLRLVYCHAMNYFQLDRNRYGPYQVLVHIENGYMANKI